MINAADTRDYGATQGKRRSVEPYPSPARPVFVVAGVILLLILSVMPLLNSIYLLDDFAFQYFIGANIPIQMCCICLGVIIIYVFTVNTFFRLAKPRMQTESTIMMIATLIITLFGMALLVVSLPLWAQSEETYANLNAHCDVSVQTHRLYEYSQVLQNLRTLPDCKVKYSIEECNGYEEAAPYTSILKHMESLYDCSGFCYRPTLTLPASSLPNFTIPGPGIPNYTSSVVNGSNVILARTHSIETPSRSSEQARSIALIAAKKGKVQKKVHKILSKSVVSSQTESFSVLKELPVVHYPPTLYSDKNFEMACEAQAARHVRNLSGDIAMQTYYQGVFLIVISIVTSFFRLLGHCIKREEPYVEQPSQEAPQA